MYFKIAILFHNIAVFTGSCDRINATLLIIKNFFNLKNLTIAKLCNISVYTVYEILSKVDLFISKEHIFNQTAINAWMKTYGYKIQQKLKK